jgi:hypothetical protein
VVHLLQQSLFAFAVLQPRNHVVGVRIRSKNATKRRSCTRTLSCQHFVVRQLALAHQRRTSAEQRVRLDLEGVCRLVNLSVIVLRRTHCTVVAIVESLQPSLDVSSVRRLDVALLVCGQESAQARAAGGLVLVAQLDDGQVVRLQDSFAAPLRLHRSASGVQVGCPA